MGVDLYYCDACKECIHSDNFRSCIICSNNCDDCNNCDSHLLVEFSKKGNEYVCESCVIDYKNINFESKYKDINDFILKKGISKDEFIVVVQKTYDEEYTPEIRIVKLKNEIKNHEESIKELKKEINEYKKTNQIRN